MTGQRLAAIDTAWLHMEEPGNLMNICGVFVFEGTVDPVALRELLLERLLCFAPFRCRVVELPMRRACWQEDPDFDLDRHLVVLERTEDLFGLVSDLLSQPLDRSRPLWMMHCLPYHQGWALIARLHHAIGDGVALMHVLGHLADRVPDTYRAPHLERPSGPLPWTRSAIGLVRDVLLQPEPMTALKGSLGRAKRAAVSAPIDLESLKQARQRLGCTLNDLLLGALSGSLRAYLLKRGAVAPSIRVVMPVDLRKPQDEKLGNFFGLAFVSLPLGESEPLRRIELLKAQLARLKRSFQPAILCGILWLAGLLPRLLESLLVRLFGSRATAVVTNVPGPKVPMELRGQPLRELMFWVPQSGRLGVGISLISYANTFRIGVATDAGLIPHPEEIVQGFEVELARLVA
ncbi:DUF1298 domain-containing protein [bacterium CPR1]|nr:DUF1298 domain-containing protein [bacterium CPR1]